MTSNKKSKEKRGRFLASASAIAAAAAMGASPALAQDTPDDDEEQVVVTGTILRGNDSSVSPVGVLSADDMQQRGQTTIADVVQTLSGNNAGTLPNSFTANGAFAGGASGASLRGLLSSNTLVLVDGLRPAYYPLADDGTRNFVDLNTIPQATVERIEVLKDGASSTYGADAIAGVINIITRREFVGAEADYSHGFADRGGMDQNHFSGIWGIGDLGEQGFNFYVSAEWEHDDELRNSERGFPFNTSDFSSICGPSVLGGTTCAANGVNNGIQYDDTFLGLATSLNAMLRSANPATGAFDPGSNWEIANPDCGPRQTAVTIQPGQVVPGVSGFNVPTQVCQLDLVGEFGVISPESERLSFSSRFTFDIGDRAEGYIAGSYYQNEVEYQAVNSTIRATTTPAATGVTVTTGTLTLPTWVCPQGSYTYVCDGTEMGAMLNPQNPYAGAGRAARIVYRFGDIEQNNQFFSQSFRVAGGVRGDLDLMGHEYRYSIDASANQSDLEVTTTGMLFVRNLVEAVNQGLYNFANPELNTDAVRDFIAPTNVQSSDSKLIMVQANISTDLFELPGGAAEGGVSLSARYEALDNPSANPDTYGPENRWFTINPFGAAGSRDVESAAFELNLPLLTTLDVNLSGRYDVYSTGQAAASPKIGLRYTPFDFITFRGTYSEGFRIPSFAESFAVPTTGFTTAPQNDDCDAQHGGPGNLYCAGALGLTRAPNPDLDPEESNSLNLGFVVRPFNGWSFSADYFNIEKDGVIGTPSVGPAVAAYYAGDPIPAGFTIVPGPADPSFPLGIPAIAFIVQQAQNLSQQEVSGWDFSLRGSFDLGGVEWYTSGEATYLDSLRTNNEEYAGTIGPYAAVSAAGAPQWRLNWQNTFVAGPATFSVTAYWTEGYTSVAADFGGDPNSSDCLDDPATPGDDGSPVAHYQDGETPIVCNVDDSFYVDLHGSYDFTDNFQLYVDVSNVFDEDPALDFTTYCCGGAPYNSAWGTPGIIGRFITIGARARF